MFWKCWFDKGIHRIGDIVKNETFLTYVELQEQYGKELHFLKYYSLLSAIPSNWKQVIKSVKIKTPTHQHTSLAKLMNTQNPCKSMTQKFIESMDANKVSCKTFMGWQDTFGEISPEEWQTIFELPYRVTLEVRVRNFQYKLLHRIVYFNDKLYRWGKVPSQKCDHCDNLDGILHRFMDCQFSKDFWSLFTVWIFDTFKISLSLVFKEIIFGIDPANPKPIIEHLLLLAKYHIYKHFLGKRKPFFPLFLDEVKYCQNIEQRIAIQNGTLSKYENKWKELIANSCK